MTATALRVRRATVEDLNALRPLWTSMHLPADELEPRLTEFQVVEDEQGKIVGGIGFQVSTSQGRLHSESFSDFAIADSARELLWKRAQTLCSNHGVLRLWTRENTPFWKRIGFKAADAEDLKRLPANWNVEQASWLTLQLKDEAVINAVEQELAMFRGAQKQQSDQILQSVRTLKILATIVALIFALIAFGAAIYLLLKRPDLLHPQR